MYRHRMGKDCPDSALHKLQPLQEACSVSPLLLGSLVPLLF